MAPVDLKTHREEILKIHKEVSDPKSPTNWALFGYDGKSDVLIVVGKGDGGIQEFTDELNSGRMMYGYLKVIDPNTDLPKFVFINWQGEGVPELRKGACTSHVREVSNLLKGAHVSINARTEDDIDEETIKMKVSKASGANYSFHKEQKKDVAPIAPVGSVYQKIKPQVDIKPTLNSKFWEDLAKEESQRKENEKKMQAAEREKINKETKEREMQSSKLREQQEAERLKKIKEGQHTNTTTSAADDTQKFSIGKIKASLFEVEKKQEPPKQQPQPPRQKLQMPKMPKQEDEEPKKPVQQTIPSPVKIPAPPLQQPQNDDDDEEEEKREESIYDDTIAHADSTKNTTVTQNVVNEDIYDDTVPPRNESVSQQEENGEEIYDDTDAMHTTSTSHGVEEEYYDDAGPCTDGDLKCRATFDYQAADSDEISFDPGDIITSVKMIDEGWWYGKNSRGECGMFPANYVELIN
ncbi:hypothetical protein HELRODRAFT_161356 [Helobdella robusta]|uniref:Coactosin-like protein n=1 Tax=Helobdella robusta TaxID=6412 RepID=T1ERD9_HELRO|nr:hypothetical protein HELRODRAFT_161356 [Helobdella robusta]ESO02119.1 hypothetical protein HELRODRAFT_161356 [Helobdella robusta]